MAIAADWTDDLLSQGRHHFSLDEALRGLGSSLPAVRAALRRLKLKGRLAEPTRGFFVIVPPEYRRLRCLPANQFVHQLMAWWGETYYVTLLSAAELYGAAHHHPQVFQVMLRHHRRPIQCGPSVQVEFLVRHDLADTPVVSVNTPRGPLRIASPAATAFELVGYMDRAGHLDNVATILSELAERLDTPTLAAEAQRSPAAWTQRLGYLLEQVGQPLLAAALTPFVARVKQESALLRSRSRRGAPRDPHWKLAINATVDPDV